MAPFFWTDLIFNLGNNMCVYIIYCIYVYVYIVLLLLLVPFQSEVLILFPSPSPNPTQPLPKPTNTRLAPPPKKRWPHLEDHPRTCKWLITMVSNVSKSPISRVGSLTNGPYMAYKWG